MDKVTLARKKELQEPDEFITTSQKALNYANENRGKIAAVVGGILGILLVASVAKIVIENNRVDAFDRQSRLITRYNQMAAKESPEAAYKTMAGEFEKLFDEHSGAKGGMVARLQFADICFKQGDFDKAIPLYEKALSGFDNDPALRNVILAGLGHSYEAKKDLNSATACFEKIVASAGKVMKDEALFNLGRIYQAMGKGEKSQEAFRKIVADHPDSIYLQLVKEKVTG